MVGTMFSRQPNFVWLFLIFTVPIRDKMLTHASETWTISMTDRKQLNFIERKLYGCVSNEFYRHDGLALTSP